MAYNDQNNTGWSQVIVVLLLAVGAVWIQFPIEPDRPAPSGQGVSTRGIQDVDARLWQDPFGAIDRTGKTSSPACVTLAQSGKDVTIKSAACGTARDHSLEWLSELIQSRQRENNTPTKVMLTMVPGGNWVGADEARRRTRYAVLAGLNAEDYVPDDPEHIGYAKGKVDQIPMVMPFEWLTSQKGEPLLLIWLDDEALLRETWVENCAKAKAGCLENNKRIAPKPLSRLAEIVEKLGAQNKPGNTDKANQPTWLLIGPSSSTFLTLAVKEPGIEKSLAQLASHVPRWYSPFATLPDDKIPPSGKDGLKQKFLDKLTRVTTDDDKLASALVEELRLRRFGSGETVALVGQWDTAYSRELRGLLKEKIENEPIAGKPGRKMRVLEESYLRGIDGKLPERKDTDKKTENKEKTVIEPTEGEGQIDYLRRLSAKLKLREKDVERIGAIGVLGNDYYDKLLVLKALRPAFPDTVFFTTDVDAAMLDRDDNKHTRNLIVAAGYGLSLAPDGQKDIPPFRENDQTATYVATRQALNPDSLGSLAQEARSKAQLFEIGRSELVSLPCAEGMRYCRQQIETGAPTVLWRVGLLPVALALIIWFIATTTGFTHRQHRCAWTAIVMGTGFVSIALYFLAMGSEPLRWLEGVSIWPSEVLRLIALALALTLYWEGVRRVHRARAYLDREFFGLDHYKAGKEVSLCTHLHFVLAPARRLHRLGLWLRVRAKQAWKRAMECHQGKAMAFPSTEEQDAGDIWGIYNGSKMCAGAPRPLRLPFWASVLQFMLAYVLMAAILFELGLPKPQVPARGDLAFSVDHGVIIFTLLAHLALLFLAMYEGFRAVWLARALQGPTHWPDQIIERFWPFPEGEKPKHWPFTGGVAADHTLFDPWLDVRFIAHATEPVQRIIFYPFIVLSLLMLSRSSLFDRWGIPAFLIAIYAISITLVVIAALRMRYSAEKVRRHSIENLNTRLLELQAQGKGELVKQIEIMRKDIQEIKIGTFSPLGQQPLIKAGLTLAGSYSGIALLEFLNQMNL
ncbi:MAG: hypothetical protein PHD37_03615 [Gallionellaceae bacterium]|nr:hypothetical protein [Gallionellaceae bacterium]